MRKMTESEVKDIVQNSNGVDVIAEAAANHCCRRLCIHVS